MGSVLLPQSWLEQVYQNLRDLISVVMVCACAYTDASVLYMQIVVNVQTLFSESR